MVKYEFSNFIYLPKIKLIKVEEFMAKFWD